MQITRLVRLLHTLMLTRRAAAYTLLGMRDELGSGNRARGLRLLRTYRSLKAEISRLTSDVAMRLAALIH